MQRKQWMAAVVGAALMAALVTWKLRGGRDAERAASEGSATSATSAAGQGGSAAAKPEQPEHEHGGIRETPVDEPELRGGPPAAISDDEPRGDARLAVKVVDAAGALVAGAEVQVASRPPRLLKTDGRGELLVDGLLVERYLVTARAPAGVAGPVEVGAISKDAPAGLAPAVLRLGTGGRVEVEVVDEQQQPVTAAKVELRGVEVREASAAKGRAELTQVVPGTYQVAVWADGYVRAFRALEVSARPTAVRVELVRGAAVRGLLVDEQGKPVVGALVRYEGVGGSIPGSDLMRDAVKSDAAGNFALGALPPVGVFSLVATHAAHGTAVLEPLEVDDKGPKRDVKLVMPAGAKVRGKVVDAGGAPVAFARVRVGLTVPGARLVVPPREVFSDAKGQFIADALTRRPLTAVASDGRAVSTAQAVDTSGGDVDGVTLVLDAVGAMGGVVVDEQGRPVARAQVTAFPAALDRREQKDASGDASGGEKSAGAAGVGSAGAAGAAGAEVGHGHGGHGHGVSDPAVALELARWQLRGFPRALTDEAGAFRLTALAPGSYRLRAIRGAAAHGGRGAGEEVVAKAGDGEVRLVVASGGAVKGKVAFADGSAPEELVVAVGSSQHEVAKGELMLEGLAPQTYQLVLRGPTLVPLVVEAKVEAGKTVDLGTVVVERRAAAAKPR